MVTSCIEILGLTQRIQPKLVKQPKTKRIFLNAIVPDIGHITNSNAPQAMHKNSKLLINELKVFT